MPHIVKGLGKLPSVVPHSCDSLSPSEALRDHNCWYGIGYRTC